MSHEYGKPNQNQQHQIEKFEQLIDQRPDLKSTVYTYNTNITALSSSKGILGEKEPSQLIVGKRLAYEIVTDFAEYFAQNFALQSESFSNSLLEKFAHEYYSDKTSEDSQRWPDNQRVAVVKTILNCALEYQLGFSPEQAADNQPTLAEGSLHAIERAQTTVRAIVTEVDALDRFGKFIEDNRERFAGKTDQEIFSDFLFAREYLYQDAQETQPEQEKNALLILGSSF